MTASILIAEDREGIADQLGRHLQSEGFRVTIVRDGVEAVAATATYRPDLVLLERSLPRMDGLEVCRRLRSDPHTADLPLMIVSEDVAERDKVLGFEAGASDFITRPFGLDELVARLRALLRRPGNPRQVTLIHAGKIEVDLDRHVVSVAGRRVALTAKEIALLHELMSSDGLILSRSYLYERVWDGRPGVAVSSRTIDAHIARLRRSLGSEGRRIITVRGVGYRFEGGAEPWRAEAAGDETDGD